MKNIFPLLVMIPIVLFYSCDKNNLNETNDAYIYLKNDTLHFSYQGGEESVDITSNFKWTIKNDFSWLSVAKNSGAFFYTLKIRVSENDNFNDRKAYIIFLDENNKAKDTLHIIQDKGMFKKNVLLEAVVGQFERNGTIDAFNIQKEIVKQFGKKVNIVNFYSKLYRAGEGKEDLSTELGDYYKKELENEEDRGWCPWGIINRYKSTIKRHLWSQIVNEQINKITPIDIKINNQYDFVSQNIKVIAHIISLDKIECNIQMYLVENNVNAIQYQIGDNYIKDYTHLNVFRDVINGIWGEKIIIDKEVVYQKTYSLNDKEWNINNLNVIVFVYNNEGVLQSFQHSVIK